MNPWLYAPVVGVASLIAALTWSGALAIRNAALRKRIKAIAAHPTLKALNGAQAAIAPLLDVPARLQRTKVNIAELAADIASVTAAYLKARALLRQLSATLNDLFATVTR